MNIMPMSNMMQMCMMDICKNMSMQEMMTMCHQKGMNISMGADDVCNVVSDFLVFEAYIYYS